VKKPESVYLFNRSNSNYYLGGFDTLCVNVIVMRNLLGVVVDYAILPYLLLLVYLIIYAQLIELI